MSKFIKKFLIISQVFFLYSCTSFKASRSLKKESTFFELTNSHGNYIIQEKWGKRKNDLFLRRQTKTRQRAINFVLEDQIILFDQSGEQYLSQYKRWIDENEFFVEHRIGEKKIVSVWKTIENNGKKTIGRKTTRFLSDGRPICFFATIVQCLKNISTKSQNLKKSLSLFIIWDIWPYINEQGLNLKDGLLTEAYFTHDGFDNYKNHRYKLDVMGEGIYYHFNESGELVKRLWISKGESLIRRP